MEKLLDGRVTLLGGDCLEVLKTLPDNSIDSCVTDPPYHLISSAKGYAKPPAKPDRSDQFKRLSRGFMGTEWDGGDIAFRVELWSQVLRVIKPGGHIVAFSGTRTYHRMACAIEDAGFEIRDQLQWLYGSGFPKSHDVSKGIDRAAGAQRKVIGKTDGGLHRGSKSTVGSFTGLHAITVASTDSAKQWDGWGTCLKPAAEPICLARKPMIGTVAANVLKYGTGGLNIDGCRIGTDGGMGMVKEQSKELQSNGGWGTKKFIVDDTVRGRFPANILHDGSNDVIKSFPDQDADAYRFFYTAKADAVDRLGSNHPTVKPLDLMQWLCRLVTPFGGIVLDPFSGTGTTGEAAWREGFKAVLIEREEEYRKNIRKRMQLAKNDSTERKRIHRNPDSKPQETLF